MDVTTPADAESKQSLDRTETRDRTRSPAINKPARPSALSYMGGLPENDEPPTYNSMFGEELGSRAPPYQRPHLEPPPAAATTGQNDPPTKSASARTTPKEENTPAAEEVAPAAEKVVEKSTEVKKEAPAAELGGNRTKVSCNSAPRKPHEHEGKACRCEEWDPMRKRWIIVLVGSGDRCKIRPSDLQPMPAADSAAHVLEQGDTAVIVTNAHVPAVHRPRAVLPVQAAEKLPDGAELKDVQQEPCTLNQTERAGSPSQRAGSPSSRGGRIGWPAAKITEFISTLTELLQKNRGQVMMAQVGEKLYKALPQLRLALSAKYGSGGGLVPMIEMMIADQYAPFVLTHGERATLSLTQNVIRQRRSRNPEQREQRRRSRSPLASPLPGAPSQSAGSKPICWFYTRGQCTYGADCRNSHERAAHGQSAQAGTDWPAAHWSAAGSNSTQPADPVADQVHKHIVREGGSMPLSHLGGAWGGINRKALAMIKERYGSFREFLLAHSATHFNWDGKGPIIAREITQGDLCHRLSTVRSPQDRAAGVAVWQPGDPVLRAGEHVDDWSCASCASLNWARRTRCFKCGELKGQPSHSDQSKAVSRRGPERSKGREQCRIDRSCSGQRNSTHTRRRSRSRSKSRDQVKEGRGRRRSRSHERSHSKSREEVGGLKDRKEVERVKGVKERRRSRRRSRSRSKSRDQVKKRKEVKKRRHSRSLSSGGLNDLTGRSRQHRGCRSASAEEDIKYDCGRQGIDQPSE